MDELVSALRQSDPSQVAILASSNAERLLADWDYGAATSDQRKLSSHTLAISKALELLKNQESPETKAIVCKFASLILQKYSKILYRCISMARLAQTIPALSILRLAAELVPAEVYNCFDFSIKAIPKLLGASGAMRMAFLSFYNVLISKSSSAIRRDILTNNRKIWTSWLGQLSQDSDEFIQQSLKTWTAGILNDKTMPRLMKSGLFSDWALKQLVPLLGAKSRQSEQTRNELAEFLVLLSCSCLRSETVGWYNDSRQKTALSLLRLLKPWENPLQMDLTCRILNDLPELVSLYFDGLSTSGYTLMPKLSMFWLSFATLHTRVISLPIPKLDGEPVAETVVKNILPATASKSSLQAGLSYSASSLVQFQTAQIIHATLSKLYALQQLYTENLWDASKITEAVAERLPELSLLLKPRVDAPDLLQAACLGCARLYARSGLFPPTATLPAALLAIIDGIRVRGLDLIRVQDMLEIETLSGGGNTKWWSKLKGSNSLFTKLIKFATFNPLLSKQVSKLVEYLSQNTLIFCPQATSGAVASPVDVLLHTFTLTAAKLDNQQQQKLWNLLDEAISRCVRTPYPYIDLYPENVSPFSVALVEQLAYVPEPKEDIKVCVAAFVRDSLVSGEDTLSLLSTVHDSKDLNLGLAHDEYFEYILSASENDVLARDDLVYKMETPLDVAATMLRITRNPNLAHHLLSSVPRDLMPVLTDKSCAKLMLHGPYTDIYLQTLQINEVPYSESLATALSECAQSTWHRALAYAPAELLLKNVVAGDQSEGPIIAELTGRGICIPIEDAVTLMNDDSLAGNVELWNAQNSPDAINDIMTRTTSRPVLCALIKLTGKFVSSRDFQKDPQILAVAARYCPGSVNYETIAQVPVEINSLPLLALFASDLNDRHKAGVEAIMATTKNVLDPSLATLCCTLLGENVSDSNSGLRRFVKKAVLALTKEYAENKPLRRVQLFLQEFQNSVAIRHIWTIVQSSLLNALIEAVLGRHDTGYQDLQLIAEIVYWAPVKPGLESAKHFHTLLGRTPMNGDNSSATATLKQDTTFLENLILWMLFKHSKEVATTALSTLDVQQGVLLRYKGSISAADILLLEVLKMIENITQRSWAEKVLIWEFRSELPSKGMLAIDDYEPDALITVLSKSEKTLQVTLDKPRIIETVQNYDPDVKSRIRQLLQDDSPNGKNSFERFISELHDHDIVHHNHESYDDEFLLNALVSSDYVAKQEQIDVRVLAETGSLGYIICSLGSSDETISTIARQLLQSVSMTLTENDRIYKESLAVRLMVNKALTYLASNDKMPAYLSIILGCLFAVAINPRHFMHEKVCDWILAGPSIQSHDLPLFKLVIKSQSDNKPRELIWLAHILTSGLANGEAVNSYLKHGIFEWAFSQSALLGAKSANFRHALSLLINKAADFGAMALITRAGALATDHASLLAASVDPTRLKSWLAV